MTYALQRYGAWVVGAHFQGCRNQGPAVLVQVQQGRQGLLARLVRDRDNRDRPRTEVASGDTVFNGRASGGRGRTDSRHCPCASKLGDVADIR